MIVTVFTALYLSGSVQQIRGECNSLPSHDSAFYLADSIQGTVQTPGYAVSTEEVEAWVNRLNDVSGVSKLILLNRIVSACLQLEDGRLAERYARQAEQLAEDVIRRDNRLISASDLELKPQTFLLSGDAHRLRGLLMESQQAYQIAEQQAQYLGYPEWEIAAKQRLASLDSLVAQSDNKRKGLLGSAIRNLGSNLQSGSSDLSLKATIKVATMYENKGNYPKAVEQYQLAIVQATNLGDWVQVKQLREKVSELEDKAPEELSESLEEQQISRSEVESSNIRIKAEQAASSGNLEQSLNYYIQYVALQEELAEQKRSQELAMLEQAYEIETGQREITLLKQNEEIQNLQLSRNEAEIARQKAFRKNLGIGLILLFSLLMAVFTLYRNKRRDHRKLTDAYSELEQANTSLAIAENKVKELLSQQLSGAVASQLLASNNQAVVERSFVCVMFLDIRDFSSFAENLKPEEIIEYQNAVFGFMIDIILKRNGVVNQILGDGFMATFGAPVSTGNDCEDAFKSAMEIMEEVRQRSEAGQIPNTRIGIGLHAGYVVTGNVGTQDRKQYSITGNTVIIASRLEQLNKELKTTLVVSREVCELLPADMRLDTPFQEVYVKGRSEPLEVTAI